MTRPCSLSMLKLELGFYLSHPVFFVFLVILVRSGCDMGDVCVLSCLGVLYVYGAVSFLGVYVSI